MRIGVIGAGHMGSAMVEGWLKAGQNDIAVMNPENPRVTKFCQQHHLKLFNDAKAMMNWHPDSLVLTTPAVVTLDVVKQFQDISPQVTMISAAAGISLADLQKNFPHHAWMRIIPNIPVAVNAGTIGMAFSDNANQLKKEVLPLMNLLGNVVVVNEEQLNVVGTIGGCGPAFIDIIMDALGDAAVKHGLSRDKAYQLAASMITGSGKLALDSKLSPSTLRDQVTSPGGTTIRGVEALEKHGVRFAIMDAVDQASDN